MENKKMKVRFAPSPTGPFHIGGARSALFNWLLAKHEHGTFLVRIEDTDLERSTKESEENIKAALRWLGITWDEGIDVGGANAPYRQSERLDIYQKYTERLLKEGKAYYCYCTAEELDESRERQMAEGKTPVYSGRCRHLTDEQRQKFEAEGRKPTVRLRCPENEMLVFDDMVRGKMSFDSNGIGDFIIVKSDGMPVYNYGVVIDDAEMGITHVIRAEEHLSNTPRQLVIYHALGFEEPRFGHISLILGKDYKKMSKRHGATAVEQYKNLGYLPEAIINFLALLGWAPDDEEELFTIDQLIARFSMDRVSKNPAVFDIDKLNWINFHYMKQLTPEALLELTLPHLQAAGFVQDPTPAECERLLRMVDGLRDHIYFGAQVVEHARPFFERPSELDDECRAVLQEDTAETVLSVFESQLQEGQELTPESVKAMIKSIQKEHKIKGKSLYAPLRVALTGAMHGPDLTMIVSVLGKEECLSRLALRK